VVQQQALRDFAQAMASFFDQTNSVRPPSWRKAGRNEGFRIVGLKPCTSCGYACHADVNAAINIAAGHAVTARGGCRDAGPVNREPQLLTSFTGR